MIATRDRWQNLQRTLTHLRSLPERPPVVVIDNGSTSAPPFGLCEPGTTMITLDRNAGPAARNLGVFALDSPYVAFCDDDSWWAPGALARACELFERHPRLGLVAARILVGPDAVLDPTCLLMADSPLPYANGVPGRPVLGFLACGAVVRRTAFVEAGGFDHRYGFGGEEEILAVDLAAAGWQLSYVAEIVAHHLPVSGDPRRGRELRQLRNSLWSCWRRRSAGQAAARSARVLRGSGRDGALALVWALAGLGWVLADRRVATPALQSQLRALELDHARRSREGRL